MEENKIDLMELDQVYILPEQDHKSNDENINNMGIIEKNGGASSEKKENEIKIDKSSNFQNTFKIKDKGKKSGDTLVKPTNQVVSGETTETEVTSQIAKTSHIDHLTGLMTQFTNQINQTSCQTNQYNTQESQSSQIQQKINNIIQHISQQLDTILLEFDEVAKKAVNELHRLLPEGTVIKIDPPTTYKWDIITSMLGITEMSRLEKYSVLQDNENEYNLSEEKIYLENEENARDEEKRQSQTTSKRTLRTRKAEDEEDSNTTISNSQKHLDLDKYYVDGRPRRPANGFSYFCRDIGTIAYAAEIWKKMTDEEKRPWLDRGEKSKSEYQGLLNKWKEEQEELKTSSIRKRTVSPKNEENNNIVIMNKDKENVKGSKEKKYINNNIINYHLIHLI
ncbi:hypothetical protein C1645_740618 [Glomus cerebriforme]|uniref:HMG box domain-containing protein n=1 Tax=Glomus cerebriforme TaxID=658196 RepID=A0A397SKT9_9GLOM|nr:hypothetical protein C1645_740618 [Glomus cerebriforme]